MATSAGHPGRANEDFVGAVPGAVVLLDGASIPGTERLCRHGTAWYTRRLGSALLARLAPSDNSPLADVVAAAIGEVADEHRETCDVADPSSPQATVAVARTRGDHLDVLVLADCFVALAVRDGTTRVLTDPREVEVLGEYERLLTDLGPGTPAFDAALVAARAGVRGRRNHPGGYWVAKDDPAAAHEALVTSLPLSTLDGVALLSNGAARLVEAYATATWPEVVELLRTAGPHEVVRQVRAVEAAGDRAQPRRVTGRDDATAAWWQLGTPG
jgi:hypothetical protein